MNARGRTQFAPTGLLGLGDVCGDLLKRGCRITSLREDASLLRKRRGRRPLPGFIYVRRRGGYHPPASVTNRAATRETPHPPLKRSPFSHWRRHPHFPLRREILLQRDTPSHPLRGSSPVGRAYFCLAMLRRNHASPFGRGGAEGDGEGYCAIGAHHCRPRRQHHGAATSLRHGRTSLPKATSLARKGKHHSADLHYASLPLCASFFSYII